MQLTRAIADVGERGRAALWRLSTLARVSVRTGMPATLRWPGARLLLRELPKGKPNPSLVFRYHARNDPHRIALVVPAGLDRAGAGRDDDRVLSFHALDELIDRAAHGLEARGVGRGSAAIVMVKNRPEFLVASSAIGRLGAASVSVSWRSTHAELEYVAKHSGARAILFDADVAAVVREVAPRLEGIRRDALVAVGGEAEGFTTFDELVADRRGPVELSPEAADDAALVMYTSGTTGKPKGAVRKFPREAFAAALAFIGETPMKVGDVHLAVCPLYHATAAGFVTLSFLLGSTVVLLREFRPEAFLEAVQRYRVTTTAVVPTMLHRVLELGERTIRGYDTSSLRAIFSGGAPLPAQLAIDTMNVLGDKLYNFYGATETGLVTLAGPSDLRASPGTIGRPIPGNDVRLFADDGRECRPGEVGELFTKSYWLVDGYHADPDATRASMRDGYFSVGDLAYRDDRGCFHIAGRKRDMIISGGVNVYPAEVEAAIEKHPAVAEAAVVGVPDREWGERVRAFVVRRAGASCDEAELAAHCRSLLASYKVPRDFVFLEALPRNPTGKVLKRELRETRIP